MSSNWVPVSDIQGLVDGLAFRVPVLFAAIPLMGPSESDLVAQLEAYTALQNVTLSGSSSMGNAAYILQGVISGAPLTAGDVRAQVYNALANFGSVWNVSVKDAEIWSGEGGAVDDYGNLGGLLGGGGGGLFGWSTSIGVVGLAALAFGAYFLLREVKR